MLHGVAPLETSSQASMLAIRAGLAQALGVDTDAVAVDNTDAAAAGREAAITRDVLPGASPAQSTSSLLLEERAVEASQGFIGSIMKRMLGGRSKKPTAPKATTRKSAQQVKAPPQHVVKVSFEVGSKTPEEKSKLSLIHI